MLTKLLIASLLASSAADNYTTHKWMDRNNNCPSGYICHYTEGNPLARPFVSHGTALQIVSASAAVGGVIYVTHIMRKHGHKRAADITLATATAVEASVATANAVRQ